jgi:hypothetical protein
MPRQPSFGAGALRVLAADRAKSPAMPASWPGGMDVPPWYQESSGAAPSPANARAHRPATPNTIAYGRQRENGFGFPHAAQVLQVTRKTRDLDTNRWRAVTVYAITSLSFELGRPARLADLLRGHWAIEALHHIRDVTFAEDDSQVRTGAAPNVMAVLRNLVIGVLSRAGPVNIAAALRRHARDPRRPLATLGLSLG